MEAPKSQSLEQKRNQNCQEAQLFGNMKENIIFETAQTSMSQNHGLKQRWEAEICIIFSVVKVGSRELHQS